MKPLVATHTLLIAFFALNSGDALGDFNGVYTPPNGHPAPGKFSVCYRHTCASISEASLTTAQWKSIRSFFSDPAPANAKEERDRIAKAIAQLEVFVGAQIGTQNDKGGNMTGVFADGHQMDCVDESTNTTTYLTMMQQEGLLQYHRVQDRVTRGFLIFGWPHTTAVIQELGTKKKWVVDSWFHDNGVAPEIVPLSQWRTGWEPEVPK